MKTLSLKSIAGLLLMLNTQCRKRKYGRLRISFRDKIPSPFIQKKPQVSVAREEIEKIYTPDEHDNSIAGEFPKQSSEDIHVVDMFRHIYNIKEKERGGDPVLIGQMFSRIPESRIND